MSALHRSYVTSIFLFLLLPQIKLSAQNHRKIEFPNIPGYLTLISDLHQHTVFSDGSVWPDIRVKEAVFDGVDVISLTEHIEYQPHNKDLPHPDRNRSYQLAKEYAKNKKIIVIHGAEITRDLPPGHSNALFIKDANKLVQQNYIDVFREAKKQGAFIFWNHPNWIGQNKKGITQLSPIHEALINEGLLHGIEVANENTFASQALTLANEQELTILGTSDIHELIDWLFDIPGGGHRPVTLIFAKERSETGVKDALFDRRTVVWYQNSLIGQEKYLIPLIKSSLVVDTAYYQMYGNTKTQIANVNISNHSDATYLLNNESNFSFYHATDVIQLNPHTTTTLSVKTIAQLSSFELKFEVLNAIYSKKEHPKISLDIYIKP
ncbi:MAG: PHP domain-containing protein [Flammeovirgaceae bacterium]|nr:PHP domain-containing protein [Flammeovirgaceae bacterium]|tara:strand:+ start:263 stop:1399 length:1137 start_codon:yes stop_codon:yes gene_type:complete